MNILSWGGGVQTWTIGAMIVHGKLPKPDRIIMVDMSPYEPETLAFTREIAEPLMQSVGLTIEIVQPKKTLQHDLLKGWVVTPFWYRDEKTGKPSLQTRRSCTLHQKVKTVNDTIKRYAWDTIWLGMSADEMDRVRPTEDEKLTRGRMRTNYYPLIAFDMTRAACLGYLVAHNLPIPPKSACDLCPFSSRIRLLKNIAKDQGTYEHIQEAQQAWHRSEKHAHKYLTIFLDDLPTPAEAKAMLTAQGVEEYDNSGACGVCEF